MKYDFDKIINRKGTNSIKYDFAVERGMPKDILPLWVADMDFSAPKEVLDDIHKAVAHGIFGYSEARDEYYQAVSNWFETRFGLTFDTKDVVKSPGVVYALAQCVRGLTQPNEAVIIQTPVYYPFYSVVKDNGRKLIKNPLKYQDGKYTIDFDDFENKIKENNVKMFLFCNPHNPVGRVWSKDDISRLSTICKRHNVIIVSDEIHCDFVFEGHRHISFGLLNEDAIIATAPSKTFNLAGLQASNIIVKNPTLRSRLSSEMVHSGYSQLSTLSLVACQSAYTHGGKWLSELNEYITQNYRFAKEFFAAKLPKIKVTQLEGTYLMWCDFSAYDLSQEELNKRIIYGAKLLLTSGTAFGTEGEGFQRINLACPKATLSQALERLYNEFKEA